LIDPDLGSRRRSSGWRQLNERPSDALERRHPSVRFRRDHGDRRDGSIDLWRVTSPRRGELPVGIVDASDRARLARCVQRAEHLFEHFADVRVPKSFFRVLFVNLDRHLRHRPKGKPWRRRLSRLHRRAWLRARGERTRPRDGLPLNFWLGGGRRASSRKHGSVFMKHLPCHGVEARRRLSSVLRPRKNGPSFALGMCDGGAAVDLRERALRPQRTTGPGAQARRVGIGRLTNQ